MDASVLHRRGNKIITGGRGREGPGRERIEYRENGGSGSGIGGDGREVQRVKKSNRNM